jgi:hypothetical protein
MKELLVITRDPAGLDKVLQQLGGCVGQAADGTYRRDEGGAYVVRGADVGFLKFAMTNQGYARVIGERDIPPLATGSET